MKTLKLNNGIEIPLVGIGTNTFGKEGNSYGGALRGDSLEADLAIGNGYRHFDTAQSYRTEGVVGSSIQHSGLPREAFFVTTKLRRFEGGDLEAWVRQQITGSLEKLRTDYIDLFLIHHPWDSDDEMVRVWRIMEEYYESGVFKSIGVSNFNPVHLSLIMKEGHVKPAANQIESHIGLWNDELIHFNQANDIATVAWSPLRGLGGSQSQILEKIGRKYAKSPAQVVLRYQTERGVIVIPKSHNKDRQAENLDIFDFELTAAERDAIHG